MRRRSAFPLLRAGTVLAVFAVGIAPAAGADLPSSRSLQEVEQEIVRNRAIEAELKSRAQSATGEIEALKRRLVEMARDTQKQEKITTAFEEEIESIERRIADKSAEVTAQRDRQASLIAALQRLSRTPRGALAVGNEGPTDAIRSALLLRTAVPAVESRAKALGRELTALASLHKQRSERKDDLVRSLDALTAQRATLETTVAEKAALERSLRTDAAKAERRNAELAQKAASLKDLLDQLNRRNDVATPEPEAETADAALTAPETEASDDRGNADDADKTTEDKTANRVASLTPGDRAAATGREISILPAAGRMLLSYNQRKEDGQRLKGIRILTRPFAQVTAPRSGEVVYAGDFRGYGPLLIIRHGEGYHAVLVGMSRIDASVGDRVLLGEPVGAMGGPETTKRTLYLELRRNGQPTNPLPWLSAGTSKVSG